MKPKLLMSLALGGAIGCTAYPTYKPVPPIDCTVEAQYDFNIATAPTDFTFEMVGASVGWTAMDPTAGSSMIGAVEALTDGARCGSTAALVLRASNNNDWGSLFGFNNFGRDASEYEGLSFWARASRNTNGAFTILLDDPNTNNPDMPPLCGTDAGVPPLPPGGRDTCLNYCSDGGTGTGQSDSTGMIIPGTITAAPEPDQCGNSFQVVLQVTADWRLHTIPFSEFNQTALPNRVPNPTLAGTALRPSRLLNLIMRMPRAMPSEIWIDNLGFYRKATTTGGDGGVDAP